MNTTIKTPVCATCGSADVIADAAARWNAQTQAWEVSNVFDSGHSCERCNDECALEWVDGARFDRFDVCEAYYCLESDYNVGGVLRERPSNMRRRESCGVQLHRMKFRARPDLETDTLTPNGRAIYDAAVRRLGLPA